MANSPQAKYRAERSERVRDRKSRQLSALRTAIKKLRKAASADTDVKSLRESLGNVSSMLDSAASKGLIHSNRASRLKSRLNSLVKHIATAS